MWKGPSGHTGTKITPPSQEDEEYPAPLRYLNSAQLWQHQCCQVYIQLRKLWGWSWLFLICEPQLLLKQIFYIINLVPTWQKTRSSYWNFMVYTGNHFMSQNIQYQASNAPLQGEKNLWSWSTLKTSIGVIKKTFCIFEDIKVLIFKKYNRLELGLIYFTLSECYKLFTVKF